MTTSAISAVVPRKPATLAGWVTEVAARIRPRVRLNVALCDGTGTIILHFLGRTQIPGIVVGCRMNVEGTPWLDGDTLVMLNPLYTFVVDEASVPGVRPRCRVEGHQ